VMELLVVAMAFGVDQDAAIRAITDGWKAGISERGET
jgi:hypothetical protein